MGLLDWLTGNAKPDLSKPRLPAEELIRKLLALNSDERAWRIEDTRALSPGPLIEALEALGLTHRPDLVVRWKSDDDTARLLAKTGISSGFAVLLRLDEPNATVRSVDHDTGRTCSADGMHSSLGGFRGQATMSGYTASYKKDADGHWKTASESAVYRRHQGAHP